MEPSVEAKYMVKVVEVPKPIRPPPESLDAIKMVIKGKMLARVRKEAVDCPVMERRVSFIECFTCSNFIRRVKGEVACKGLPNPTIEVS